MLPSRHFNQRCTPHWLPIPARRIQKVTATSKLLLLLLLLLHGRTTDPSTIPPPPPRRRGIAPSGPVLSLRVAGIGFEKKKSYSNFSSTYIRTKKQLPLSDSDSLGPISMSAAAAAGQEVTPAIVAEVEEWEVCACCGLREECTPAYAAGVRALYGGRWLCGLCGDAVSEEVAAGSGSVLEVEAAIARHAAFCRAIGGRRTTVAAERLIAAVRRLLRNGSGKQEKAVVVVEFQEP